MKIYGYIGFFCLLLFAGMASAQQNNVWIFSSGSSLDFNYEPPRPLPKDPPGISFANYGVICDSLGQLELYSGGRRIYNRHYKVIANGDSIIGTGNLSKSTLFLQPDENRYYLFTVNQKFFDSMNAPFGLYLSVIDRHTQTVTKKNLVLDSGYYYTLAAVRHANRKDYWVISRKYPDTFVFIKVSERGIDTIMKQPYNTPYTISYANPPHPAAILNLYPSNDGKSLVECARFSLYNYIDSILNWQDINYNSYVNIYEFDPEKGRIINKRIIENYYTSIGSENYYAAAAFSPNDSFFYVTNVQQRQVNQYERYAPDIRVSKISTNPYPGVLYGIQLAPNGKIYINRQWVPYVVYIDNPNTKGIKQIMTYKVRISKTDHYGTCQFPNVFFEYMRLKFKYRLVCDRSPNFINLSDTNIFKYFTWYFEGGDSQQGTNVYYDFPASGRYFVKLKGKTPKGYTQWFSDSITFYKKPEANFGYGQSVGCRWVGFQFADSSWSDVIKKSYTRTWLWDFGDGTYDTVQNPSHIYTKTGLYNVKLIYGNGYCYDTLLRPQAVEIIDAPKPGFEVNQSHYCTPFTLKVTSTASGYIRSVNYRLSDGRTDSVDNPVFDISLPGAYRLWQTVTGPTGCVTSDSLMLYFTRGYNGTETVNSLTTTVAGKKQVDITWRGHPVARQYSLLKSTGEESFFETALQPDTFYIDHDVDAGQNIYSYKILGIDSCGRVSSESRILKTMLLSGETHGNDYSIITWTPFEQWQKGVDKYIVEARQADGNFVGLGELSGFTYRDNTFLDDLNHFEKCYRIRAIEKDGNRQQSISNEICLPYETVVWIPNSFTPNGDGLNDSFSIFSIAVKEMHLKIFNRWGEILFSSDDKSKSWTGINGSKPVKQGVYYYQITGIANNGKSFIYEGNVTVVR